MSEETKVVEQTTQAETTTTPPVVASPFGNNWSETLPEVKKQEEQTAVQQEATTTQTAEQKTEEPEEILDPKDWLKREFEIDDPEVLKQQIKEYKELKTKEPESLKFENEESKQLHELIRQGKTKEAIRVINTQERLGELTGLEVNETTAADIIKMGMQLKYPDLTQREIDYKFNKQFAIPKEPVYDETKETESEFEERKSIWQEQVSDVKMNLNIEAKLAKPELEKAKVQLVLPEIDKPKVEKANEPDPEVLKKAAENFLNKLESDYSKTEGFSTKVKDESVELPISFKIPDEDKTAIKEMFKKGFDTNDYFDKRWFDEQGNPKIEKMISDIFLLENPDKLLSGVANNSANERLKAYRKQTSQIDVAGGTSQQTFSENGGSKISPYAKDAWSDKPPSSINN